MQITIQSPEGPRNGAEPAIGISDERSLVKSLLVTLAVECARGNPSVVLEVDLSGVGAETLITIARALTAKATSTSNLRTGVPINES